ncbi:MAG: O-antigen ligase family protein [Candidatus Marinimicrobia bacterium]|nr:O-antigen ligase family protein [Candidatus Neomarinimicrobiota bacterium]
MTTKVQKYFHYSLFIILTAPLFTVFIWSDKLVNGRYTTKAFYFYLVSVIVFSMIGISLFAKQSIKIKLNKLDIAILIFYLYSVVRMLFTPNTPVNNTRFLNHTILLGFYFLWKYHLSGRNNQVPIRISILLLLIVGLGQALHGLLQLYNIIPVPPNIGGFKVFGSFGAPNHYASFLGPFLPISLGVYLLLHSKNIFNVILKNVAMVTFLTCFLVLPATQSRSSWVGALAGSTLVIEYKYGLFEKLKEILNKTWKKITFAVIVLGVLSSGLFIIYNFKKDSAFGRLLQWKISSRMIKERPVFGHGYDTFGLHYNNYQSEYFQEQERPDKEKLIAGNSKEAHNDYIEILSELGIVGLILFLAIFYLLFNQYKRLNKNSKNNNIQILLFAGIGPIIVMALFTFPFQILPHYVIFVFLVSGISNYKDDIFSFKINSLLLKTSVIFLFILLSLFTFGQYTNYNAHIKWNRANQLVKYQSYKAAEKIYQNLYPELKKNGSYLLNYGGTLALDSLYKKAIPILKQSKKYLNDPNLYLSLGNCYKEVGEIQKAAKYYKKAEGIVPHQMYPKYLLVKLYKKNNKMNKAISKANEIIDMKIKINSTAIRQMKNEVKNYLKMVRTS